MDFIHFLDPALLTLEPKKQFALFFGLFYGNTSDVKISRHLPTRLIVNVRLKAESLKSIHG
jgi:hypothetical protein